MSKLLCRCGHLIRDNTDLLPYKAFYMNDSTWPKLFDKIDKEVESIIDAVSNGTLKEWVKERWKVRSEWTPEPKMLIRDRLSSIHVDHTSGMYECVKCGCLWIEKGKTNTFIPYMPESKEYEGVLKEKDENA